tara:strand:- start:418 stop:630 length:213 start_codon:yes stop_codon:yes gene_type:complete
MLQATVPKAFQEAYQVEALIAVPGVAPQGAYQAKAQVAVLGAPQGAYQVGAQAAAQKEVLVGVLKINTRN